MANPLHVRPGDEELGERLRVLALPRVAQLERCEGTMREPDLERTGDRAQTPPPRAQLLGSAHVARDDVAQNEVAVSARALARARNGEVGAERERSLAERRRK